MNHIRSVSLLCVSLCWTTSASAGLSEKPPRNFDTAVAGAWQIDATRSDDPRAELDKAREKMARNRGGSGQGERGGFGGPERGGPPGGGGPGGRRGPGGGPPGGGVPGGPGGGGYRGEGGMPPGSPPAGQLLDELAASPATLTFARIDRRVKVLTGEHSVSCMAGAVASFSDSTGSGERRCGWSGEAWVVETTRGKDFDRTDRYETSRDGNTLIYTTTVMSQRMGKIRIVRVYTRTAK